MEHEQGLLGAILINNEALLMVQEFLRAEHFYEPLHRYIYEVCEKLINMGKAATPITLRAFIPEHMIAFDHNTGDQKSMSWYLARLAAESVPLIVVRDFATNIRDLAAHRKLMEVGHVLTQMQPVEITEAATQALEEIDGIIAEQISTTARGISMQEAVAGAIDASAKAYQNNGRITGLSWGLRDLDMKTNGLHAGELIIIAGRPSMGKTALALSTARALGKAGEPGVLFSMEMDATPVTHRMITDEMYETMQLNYSLLRSGRFAESSFDKICKAGEVVATWPIHIEQRQLSVTQIAAIARRRKKRHGLKWIMIDYLGQVKPTGRYEGNKNLEIGEITSGLKALAKELEIPVILLCQLNRKVEARDDKRPNLGDLRESGDIEQDADVVLMVYRHSYYVERAMPQNARTDSEEYASWAVKMQQCMNTVDAIIEKQRQGPIGTVKLFCNIGCNAFRDIQIDDAA